MDSLGQEARQHQHHQQRKVESDGDLTRGQAHRTSYNHPRSMSVDRGINEYRENRTPSELSRKKHSPLKDRAGPPPTIPAPTPTRGGLSRKHVKVVRRQRSKSNDTVLRGGGRSGGESPTRKKRVRMQRDSLKSRHRFRVSGEMVDDSAAEDEWDEIVSKMDLR